MSRTIRPHREWRRRSKDSRRSPLCCGRTRLEYPAPLSHRGLLRSSGTKLPRGRFLSVSANLLPAANSKGRWRGLKNFLVLAILMPSAMHSRSAPNGGACDFHIVGGTDAAYRVQEGLRRGELAIVIRHAEALQGQESPIRLPTKECETYPSSERRVTIKGECQLGKIRSALKRVRANPFLIHYSPICRTEQTARFLGESAPPTKEERLLLHGGSTPLSDLLRLKTRERSNLLLVTHSGNISDLTGIPAALAEENAIAVLVETADDSRPRTARCLGYMLPEDWETLEATSATKR